MQDFENKKLPGYTGYKPQFQEDKALANEKAVRDNRYYIPGYCGYVPKIKAENAFGQSYGKTTAASVKGEITQGYEFKPEDKFRSMTQDKFTDQATQMRVMRPAQCFEPGYDSVHYIASDDTRPYVPKQKADEGLTLTYKEAATIAFGKDYAGLK